jgi:hypothetical protein
MEENFAGRKQPTAKMWNFNTGTWLPAILEGNICFPSYIPGQGSFDGCTDICDGQKLRDKLTCVVPSKGFILL